MNQLKKLFALLLALVLVLSAAPAAFAAGIEYKYSVELEMGVDEDTGAPAWVASGILRVGGIGKMEDSPGIVAKNVDRLKYAVVSEGVSELGRGAFGQCSNLQHVSLPESLKVIGRSAFNFCTSLESITLPKGITAIDNYVFYYCLSLKQMRIPDGVKSIGQESFYRCVELVEIYIPDSVKEIHPTAFNQCDKLLILANAGSYAESFAKENGYRFKALDETVDLDALFTVDEFVAPEGNENFRESDLIRANDELTGYGIHPEDEPKEDVKDEEPAAESKSPVVWIAAGSAGAVIAAGVVAVVIIALNKKKKDEEPAEGAKDEPKEE